MVKKLLVVTCQPDPDYVRARTLRAGLAALSYIEILILKNRNRSVLRYLEVAWKLIQIRLKHNPEIYLLTFRGYEILPWLLLLARGKKVIFDEFINPIEWIAYEHKLLNPNSIACKTLSHFYRGLLRRCEAIITDTESHATLSASLTNITTHKYFAIPVGADETVFFPLIKKESRNSDAFKIFFYGNILPLHGLDIILDAALLLKDYHDIEFLLVGGRAEHVSKIKEVMKYGARIVYRQYIPFEQLADQIHQASVCLAGPFGNTVQAQHVITGKTFQFLACASPTIVGRNLASDVFSDKQNVLLVPQGDSLSLSEAILWGHTHRDHLKRIGESGRVLYESVFSENSISAALSDLLTQLN